MVSKPLFTIVTVSYNSEKWIAQAIESVLSSSFRDYEYIIADDCSTDKSWEIICKYDHPQIRNFRNENNIGEYFNRNKALEAARGKYLLFVDGDDILYIHALRNLSEYIEAFPQAGMIWGVSPFHVDFAVMPFLLYPEMLMRLVYETTRPFANIGFSETIFKVQDLRSSGGLPTRFSTGDTYIKKRMGSTYPVLFVPMGFVFWRHSTFQASKMVSMNHKGFIESFKIDLEILHDVPLSHREELIKKVKGSFLRRLIGHTLKKGKLLEFLRLFHKSGLQWTDFKNLFKTFSSDYSPVTDCSFPLYNDFNFKPK